MKIKDLKSLLIPGIAMASLFLTHYPIGVIGCVFIGVVLILYFKEFKYKGFLIILGILFGLSWALRSYRYQVLLQENLVNPDRTSVGYNNGSETIRDAISYFFVHYRDNLRTSLRNWDRYPTLVSFVALPLMLTISIYKKNKQLFLIFFWFLSVLLLMIFLSGLRLSILTIILESYLISILMYIYIFTGFFISQVYRFSIKKFLDEKKWHYILIGIFLSGMFLISYMLFQQNRGFMSSPNNSVVEDDVKIFNWIEENTLKEDKFLINAYTFYDIIFSSDAGGYIEVFTGRKISTPFYEYDYKDTHQNYEYYKKLRGNLDDCTYRQKLIDLGYKYYYHGALQPFHEPLLSEDDVFLNPGFKLVYQSGDSILFKIIGCE